MTDVPGTRVDDTTLLAAKNSIRVASVPASHVYVRHIAPEATRQSRVIRLDDPHPSEPGRSAVSVWWPPRMLDPNWVRENAEAFDLFHVQFGFDAVSPATLRDLVLELKSAGIPLVYTAHDLRNPHHSSRGAHDEQLDVVMSEADAVLTLTPGAAAEIKTRWGRDAAVIAHPHVVDFEAMEAARLRRESGTSHPYRIGMHVKSLRANMNPLPLVRALAETQHERADTVLQVDVHTDVMDVGGDHFDPELSRTLRGYADLGVIDLRVHDFFTDEELWAYLESLDASVLPYRFGTHSGWLEACRDLGTAVIAPTCGYYAEQGPVTLYRNDENGFDPDSLIAAVGRQSRVVTPSPLTVDFRRTQREQIAHTHESLYRELLA